MMEKRGFTLIEIMIVVAIIAMLAAIAIPNLMSAKKSANEAAAKANIRTLCTAAEIYATQNNGNYPPSDTLLATFASAATSLCGHDSQGYHYTCTYGTNVYTFTATPTSTTGGSKTFQASTGAVFTEN